MTEKTSQSDSHHSHIDLEKSHWRKRWSPDSMCSLQNTHMASEGEIMPNLDSLSFVFSLPRIAIQTKISIQWGTKPFHTFLRFSAGTKGDILSNSRVKDFTEKRLYFSGAQTILSANLRFKTTSFNRSWSWASSTWSCTRSCRFYSKLHCHESPSQKPIEDTIPIWVVRE